MIGVIVFYRAYQLPKKVAPIPSKLESPSLSSNFISPRLVDDSKGYSKLLLDLDFLEDFRALANVHTVADNSDTPKQQTREYSSVSGNGLTASLKADKKIQLKSVCCEKYKKGSRCKRCPCFDLQ